MVRCCFFFFKQKTAYEMRISDWSSDVCSSDLPFGDEIGGRENFGRLSVEHQVIVAEMRAADVPVKILGLEIDPIGIGQQSVERGLNVAHLVRIDVRRGGELASNGLGLVCR